MNESLFHGRRILLAEDEWLIAEEMRLNLEKAGATVVGPVASVGAALSLIESDQIDIAFLDVSLRGQKVFPVAEVLAARGIPVLFTTGYGEMDLPAQWRSAPRCEKPVNLATAAQVLTNAGLHREQGADEDAVA